MNNNNNNLNNIKLNINNSYDHQGSEENNKKNYYSLNKNNPSPYLQRITIYNQIIGITNQNLLKKKNTVT